MHACVYAQSPGNVLVPHAADLLYTFNRLQLLSGEDAGGCAPIQNATTTNHKWHHNADVLFVFFNDKHTYYIYIYIYINQNIFHSHITFLFDFIQDNDHKHAMHPYIIAGYTHIRVAG